MPDSREKARSLIIVVVIYVVALALGLVAALVVPTANLLTAALVADVVATVVVFAASRIAGNSSLYDPYWSVVPPFIAAFWIVALSSGQAGSYGPTARVALLAASVPLLIWAIRLTANWVRRWRGTSDEDWRYEMLKGMLGRFDWLIDFLGIHLFPTMQVFLGMVPFYFLADRLLVGGPATPAAWGAMIAGAVIMLAAVGLESVADRQLARFRREGGTGLLKTGIWGVMRRPNYLGEILFWWGLWVASLAGAVPVWTVIGPLAMTALFVFISIPMMDHHLERRHAASANE